MSSCAQIKLIDTLAALETLVPAWTDLWRQDPCATPFQSPAWLIPWWKNLGPGDLLAIEVSQGKVLTGVLPCYLYLDPETSCRKLLLLGAGTSDYLGGVFDPVNPAEPIRAALRFLLRQKEQCDVSHFTQLTPECEMASVAEELGLHLFQTEPCSRLALPHDGEMHGKIRQNLTRYRNIAAKKGAIQYEVATEENALELLQSLIDLHSLRWRVRGGPGVLGDERIQRAHRESIPALLKEGLLRLYALSIGNRRVAVLYGLVDDCSRSDRSFYSYLGGFDPQFAESSPGSLLLAFAIKQAAKEGLSYFDFLRGGERYKHYWGAAPRATVGFSLGNSDYASAGHSGSGAETKVQATEIYGSSS